MIGVGVAGIWATAAVRMPSAAPSTPASTRMDSLRRADPTSPCGAVSATVAAQLLEVPLSLDEAVKAVPADPLGRTSMKELIAGLRKLGFAAEGLRLSPDGLWATRGPAILHVHGSHFLVACGDGGGDVVLIDPPSAPRLVPASALRKIWRGNAVLVRRDADAMNASLAALGLETTSK